MICMNMLEFYDNLLKYFQISLLLSYLRIVGSGHVPFKLTITSIHILVRLLNNVPLGLGLCFQYLFFRIAKHLLYIHPTIVFSFQVVSVFAPKVVG